MSHFYVTLPCDSSLSFFPKNTVAQYNTKLAERICLDGDYEVALVDFIYPWSFHNTKLRDDLSITLRKSDGTQIFKYTLEDSYYTSETEFADILNEKIRNRMRRVSDLKDSYILFSFDKSTRKMDMTLLLEDDEMTLNMSAGLRSKFGFCKVGPYKHGSHQAGDVFDLTAGHRLMYIYCDIASHALLGNTKSPLLRICSTRGKYGDTIRETFNRPFYIPVAVREFDTISIDIRDELGQPMPFAFGKSVVTLHFRRMHNLMSS